MNFAGLDLNLLVSLDALLHERNVTRAAQRVGLSQPALSAALARLRRHFDDQLLVRQGNTYRLTPLAVRLKERTTVALAGAERVFASQPDFDPATSEREFTILTSDYSTTVLLPALMDVLDRSAPGVRVRLRNHTTRDVDRASVSLQTADALIMPHGFLPGLPHQDLWNDRWVCLVSRDNTAVAERLTLEQLVELPWVLSYHEATADTPAARQLRLLGIEPRVRLVTEGFLTVPALIAGTGRVALLQEMLARRVPAGTGVRILPCPFDAVPLVEAMWWHPLHHDDPGHRFLRTAVEEAARRVTAHQADGRPRPGEK